MRIIVIFVCLMGALWGGSLQERIEGVIEEVDPTALVGMKVVSLDSGKVLYERNASARFVPASSLKLFTMGAALEVLGSEDRFETRVMGDGFIEKGILKGNCYLVGSGDPSLKGVDLLELVKELNIREIRGDLVLDMSCFKDDPMGPGWMWDEEPAFWSVLMSGLNVEHNFAFGAAIQKPEELVASLFSGLLSRKGIVFKGKVRVGKAPEGAFCLASHFSEPIKELIKDALQDSDNLYADCMFKRMGGSWEKGRESVEGFLREKIGIDPEEMRIVDGSGLSRYNLISPEQAVKFLKEMRSNEALVSALAIGGEVGKYMKRRMAGFEGKVRAKSGGMTGVSALCGYVTTDAGEELAVAIFVNGYVINGREIKLKMEDGICQVLVKLRS